MRRGLVVLIGLLVCLAISAGAVLILVRDAPSFSGCDDPDVPDSIPPEGLGAAQSSSVADFPVPDLAVENTCDLDAIDYGVEPDELVEYLLPPDATVDVVIGWYLAQGIAGQPYSTFEWCGVATNWLAWVEPADPPRYLDAVVRVDDAGEEPTHLGVSIGAVPIREADKPVCP